MINAGDGDVITQQQFLIIVSVRSAGLCSTSPRCLVQERETKPFWTFMVVQCSLSNSFVCLSFQSCSYINAARSAMPTVELCCVICSYRYLEGAYTYNCDFATNSDVPLTHVNGGKSSGVDWLNPVDELSNFCSKNILTRSWRVHKIFKVFLPLLTRTTLFLRSISRKAENILFISSLFLPKMTKIYCRTGTSYT